MNVLKEKIKQLFLGNNSAGKAFDIILIISILLSVALVMLDSIDAYNIKYGERSTF